MSQTLINGTAYEIDHGNTLINSTQYTIDHGNTMVDGTQYKIEFGGGYTLDDWVGWENATWEDINNLCYAKQIGLIDSWPEDVVVGAIKQETLSQAVLGTTTHYVRVIGIDQDGDGTITFEVRDGLTEKILMAYGDQVSSSARWTNLWTDSNLRTLCKTYGDSFSGKSYVRRVNKGTCLGDGDVTNRAGTATYLEEDFWLLSEFEVGLDAQGPISTSNSSSTNAECTYGYASPYTYYTSDAVRKKSAAWFLRSHRYNRGTVSSYSSSRCLVGSSGSASHTGSTTAYLLVPCFVIGNPEAQTIE